MKNKWIKNGDKVLVISGNDKGKVGEVIARSQDRILIKDVNVRKKHMKARQQGQKSEIVKMERPIHISNVALCNEEGKKIKLKQKQGENKSKDLVFLENGKETVYRTLRKLNK